MARHPWPKTKCPECEREIAWSQLHQHLALQHAVPITEAYHRADELRAKRGATPRMWTPGSSSPRPKPQQQIREEGSPFGTSGVATGRTAAPSAPKPAPKPKPKPRATPPRRAARAALEEESTRADDDGFDFEALWNADMGLDE
ncbi:MAG: hypothetical protein ACKVWV_20380 [Planctomycetota bacterium]